MSVIEHPYRSSRLFYRALESPRDDEFFHQIQADPFSQDTSSPALLKPMHRTTSTKIRNSFEEDALGVLICLPSTEENLKIAGESYKKEDLQKPSLVRDEPIDMGIPIGAMSLEREHGTPKMFHTVKGEIAIDIAPKYQRKGYGREALIWLLDWGFCHGNFHRISIRVLGWNHGARKLYESIGFKVESVVREAWWHNGSYHDDIGLGILAREWREGRATKEVRSETTVVAGEVTLLTAN